MGLFPPLVGMEYAPLVIEHVLMKRCNQQYSEIMMMDIDDKISIFELEYEIIKAENTETDEIN